MTVQPPFSCLMGVCLKVCPSRTLTLLAQDSSSWYWLHLQILHKSLHLEHSSFCMHLFSFNWVTGWFCFWLLGLEEERCSACSCWVRKICLQKGLTSHAWDLLFGLNWKNRFSCLKIRDLESETAILKSLRVRICNIQQCLHPSILPPK
jgi:hypothetical protein